MLAALLLAGPAAAANEGEEPKTPVPEAGGGKTEKGAWSAGVDATALGMPDAAASPTVAEVAESGSEERGQFFAVPIPRLDPALGAGLIGVGAYLFKLDPDDEETPSSIAGAAAFWMSGGSWGGGAGTKLYLKEDRIRLLGGFAYADLKYDLFVTPRVTGKEKRIPLAQVVYGGLAHAQFRVAPDLYLGIRGATGAIEMQLRAGDLPPLAAAIAEWIERTVRFSRLGPSLALDRRDNPYYPRHGLAFDFNADIYFGDFRGDLTYGSYEANYRQYTSLRERDVLAWQGYVCVTADEAPFFLQCQVGPSSLIRGYSFGRYWGPTMAAAQAEYRWQVGRRWILAAFGGVAEVADTFGSFTYDGLLPAGGAGVRFVVEPKNGVTMRADYAWGKGESALYISVGEAF